MSSYPELKQRIESTIAENNGDGRKLIAIAGPPASGKSTLLAAIVQSLQKQFGEERVVGIPMDGFHLDNDQLDLDGSRARKGAPDTFDVGGIQSLVLRLGTKESPIYAPEFDRASDLSRNCAIKIDSQHDVVLIEGNYLLLDGPGWKDLSQHFDLTVRIDVPVNTLRERLVQRWLHHGLDEDAATKRALSNDIPNAETVLSQSTEADFVYRPEILK